MDDEKHLEGLVSMLNRSFVDEFLTEDLSMIGKPAVLALVAALENVKFITADNVTFMNNAVNALRNMMKDESAVPELERLLYVKMPEARKMAANALGEIGGEQAFDALVKFLSRKEFEDGAFAESSQSLVKFGRKGVDALIEIMEWRNDTSELSMMGGLKKTKDPASVPSLAAGLGSNSQWVREGCAGGIRNVGDAALPYLVKSARDSKNLMLRREILELTVEIRKNAKPGASMPGCGMADLGLRQSLMKRNFIMGAGAIQPRSRTRKVALLR